MTTSHPLAGRPGDPAWPLLATLAVALPTVIAFNVPPSATFFNQASSLIGWGLWLMLPALALPAAAWHVRGPVLALLAALGIVLAAALVAPLWAGLPWSLALSSSGLIAAGGFVALCGAACAGSGLGERAFRAFCIGLVVAGLAGSAIGIVQVYRPAWVDGDWVAHTALPGRASGNVRQPNHLSSILLWALVAVAWLAETTRLRRGAALAIGAVMLFVAVLTASRTGAVDALGLAAWGLLDRRLGRRTRLALMLVPVAYIVFWLGITEWAHASHQVFGGEARFLGKGDVSASRFGIWSNTLSLIAAQPWLGVGFGEFNFAWSLTPFPGRPVAFFDHTHNLLLQFAVELGVPLALLIGALLAFALVEAWRRAARSGADGQPAPYERAAVLMVLMAVVHSQLEYPLWYAYFLLPCAFAWGLCLPSGARGAEPPARNDAVGGEPGHPTRPLLLAAMALVLAGGVGLWDYARVVVIFAPPEGAASLEQRIEEGRHSWFFAPHADYAAATVPEHPSTAMPSFRVATHYLLDARLLMAWAKALDESGDDDRARWVAQRLREFRNEASASFFAPCADETVSPKPFQCRPPTRTFTFRDFR